MRTATDDLQELEGIRRYNAEHPEKDDDQLRAKRTVLCVLALLAFTIAFGGYDTLVNCAGKKERAPAEHEISVTTEAAPYPNRDGRAQPRPLKAN